MAERVVIIGNGSRAHEFARDVLGLPAAVYDVVQSGQHHAPHHVLEVLESTRATPVLVYYLWTRRSPFDNADHEMLAVARERSRAVIVVTDWHT